MKSAARGKPRIWLKELVERHVASVRATCQPHRVKRTVVAFHELVMDAVGLQGLAPAGPLYVRYHDVGSVVDLEAGIPLAQPILAQGQVTPGTLPGGPALCAIHNGPAGELHHTVRALHSFCKRTGLVASGGYWACYVTNPPQDGEGMDREIAVYLPVTRVRSNGRGPKEGATRGAKRSQRVVTEEMVAERVGTSLRTLLPLHGPHWMPPAAQHQLAPVVVHVDRANGSLPTVGGHRSPREEARPGR